VELLDKYFGSVRSSYQLTLMIRSPAQVCELDIIFNFEKAYFMLDELLIGGEVQETSKKNVLKAIAAQDLLQEVITNPQIQFSARTKSNFLLRRRRHRDSSRMRGSASPG
jgi:hypothetical protein